MTLIHKDQILWDTTNYTIVVVLPSLAIVMNIIKHLSIGILSALLMIYSPGPTIRPNKQ